MLMARPANDRTRPRRPLELRLPTLAISAADALMKTILGRVATQEDLCGYRGQFITSYFDTIKGELITRGDAQEQYKSVAECQALNFGTEFHLCKALLSRVGLLSALLTYSRQSLRFIGDSFLIYISISATLSFGTFSLSTLFCIHRSCLEH